MKFASAAAVAVSFATLALAQDPPSRVARLNLINGQVSFQPATVDDWTEATLNYPLTTGDHLFTDQGARAEMRIGPNSLRLNSQTNFGFLNLSDSVTQVRLTEGSLNIRLRSAGEGEVWEIDTPNGAISLLRSGEYRIDTDPQRNATMVTVWTGEAEITAGGQAFPVRPRQTAFFTGDGGQQVLEANPADAFDTFCRDRDRREDSVAAPVYVSESMVGYEDLDSNGTWSTVAEYGPVWRPRVRVGWSPYHDGRWAWVEPWGWTWIDDAPWGFAPFHYGRWAYVGGGWGWCPGPVVVQRPVYAPALVAFVGGGNWGVSLSFGGGGGVGWFPLGPREIYAPGYRVSPGYVRQVNYTNVRNIDNVTINNIVVNRTVNNTFVNRGAPGGFTAVSRNDFAGSRSVQRAAVNVPQGAVMSAPVAGYSAQVAPRTDSVFGRPQGSVNSVARPSQESVDRQVFAKSTPPPAAVPFAARQQALQQTEGRPMDQNAMRGFAGQQVQRPAVRAASEPIDSGRQPGPGSFGRPQAAPVAQPGVDQNRGFRQPAQQPAVQTPATVPQDRLSTRPPAAQPQGAPEPNRTFGRDPAPQDRLNTRPPTAQPQSVTEPNRPEPNRTFGREQPANPPQDRLSTRPPAAQPRAVQQEAAPQPTRNFDRPAPTPRPEVQRPQPEQRVEQQQQRQEQRQQQQEQRREIKQEQRPAPKQEKKPEKEEEKKKP